MLTVVYCLYFLPRYIRVTYNESKQFSATLDNNNSLIVPLSLFLYLPHDYTLTSKSVLIYAEKFHFCSTVNQRVYPMGFKFLISRYLNGC